MPDRPGSRRDHNVTISIVFDSMRETAIEQSAFVKIELGACFRLADYK
jgi:hypothetical protein